MMHTCNSKLSALGLLTVLASPIAANRGYYMEFYSAPALTVERLDPLLSPGGISNHVHSVIGGNKFAAQTSYQALQESTCTTVPINNDLSAYWMPAMYFHNSTGFHRMREIYHKVYYFYGNGNQQLISDIEEFPEGFHMITGNAMLREEDPSHKESGVHWACTQSSGTSPSAVGFPKGFTSCPGVYGTQGLSAGIQFPDCWDGVPFDPIDTMKHMAHAGGADGLAGCPAPFNKHRFPKIGLEYTVDTEPFKGSYTAADTPWTLAMGDPTGYGFHADFINGWKKGSLKAAMTGCTCGDECGTDQLSQCFANNGGVIDISKISCQIQSTVPESVGDVGGKPLDKLPGCNPVQPGPQMAVLHTDCAGLTGSTAPTVNSSSSGTSGSSSTAPVTTSDAAVSSSGSSSYVAASTSVSSYPASPSDASTSSAGSPTSSADSVPTDSNNNPTISPITTPLTTSPSSGGYNGSSSPSSGSSKSCDKSNFGGSWKYLGCFADNNDRVMKGIHLAYLGYQNVTSTGCADHCDGRGFHYSGTEAGGQCFCSHEAPKKTSDNCNACCEGAAGKDEVCGGGWALSVYAKPGSTKRTHRHRRGAHQFAKLS